MFIKMSILIFGNVLIDVQIQGDENMLKEHKLKPDDSIESEEL